MQVSRYAQRSNRRGAVTVLVAVLMVVLVGMLAFAVDLGYVCLTQAEIVHATDAGALAGASALVEGEEVAIAEAIAYVQRNSVGGGTLEQSEIDVELGDWNVETRTFTAGGDKPSAIRVSTLALNRPTFFGRVLGVTSFDAGAEAIARFKPRDIVLVLDYSGSMNDDSELKSERTMGADAVDANLQQIYGELGSPTLGSMQWDQTLSSSWSASQVRQYLGLDAVPYPYPSGTWNNYISYVKNSVPSAYRHHYGYKTFVNYLLEKQPQANQTPTLWQTSEQPVTAVKNAVSVFLGYLQETDSDDRLGLSVYTAADGTALLESQLTDDYDAIETISRQRQAAHYQPYTNIGDGIRVAREELEEHGRIGALRMILLMTDGIANRPNDATYARTYALQQAQLSADAGFPIVTISFGSGADVDLMQQIADTTGGVHFNIPGGQSVADYEEDLKDVFREVADKRPIQLVK